MRRGARAILQRAIRAELELLLDDLAEVSLIDGRRAVMRNGHLPAREILTTVGPVEVRVPKVRDRTGAGVKFNSALAPPYVRRSARGAAALPWLYLKGASSGDLGEALEVLVGDGAKGLSPAALGRLKAQWSAEYQGWTLRSLAGKEYAYFWLDGIYTRLRESEDPKLCLLVIIGVTPDGTKKWVAIEDGLRESTESWLNEALRETLRGQVPEGDGQARQVSRRPARLLRLPHGALRAPAHDQPDQVHVRDRAPPHRAAPKNCVSRNTFLGLALKLADEAAKSAAPPRPGEGRRAA